MKKDMTMKKAYIIAIAIILLSLIAALYFYPKMPDQMASHWNAAGEADNTMSKFWGLFLMPMIMVATFLLLYFMPKIDPLKRNVEKFREYYESFIIFIMLFFVYIYSLSILWNLDYRFNMSTMMVPAIAFLFYYAGILMERSKRNWFIGIKTPWTLSSDYVWNKTNQLGGRLFKVCAVISLVGLVLKELMVWFVLLPVLATVVTVFTYSYLLYKKHPEKGRKRP